MAMKKEKQDLFVLWGEATNSGTNFAVITVNDDQQDPTILAYSFIPNLLYMFRAMFRPSSGALDCIYSF